MGKTSIFIFLVYFFLFLNFFVFLLALFQNILRNISLLIKDSIKKRFSLIIEEAIIKSKMLKASDFKLRFWQKTILIELLFEYKTKFAGSFAKNVDDILAEIGYEKLIKKKLKKTGKAKLFAIQQLGFWDSPVSGEILRKLLPDKDLNIRKEVIRALANICYLPALKDIFKYYPDKVDYSLLAALVSYGKFLKPYLKKLSAKRLKSTGLELIKGEI